METKYPPYYIVINTDSQMMPATSFKMTTITTHGVKRLSIHKAAAEKNTSLQHRCEVQRKKGVNIERGLITVVGLGGLSQLVDMAVLSLCSLLCFCLF